MVDSEGAALAAFLRMLGIYIKEIKDRAAAQVQLALGFWWDSINRTRTLSERKQQGTSRCCASLRRVGRCRCASGSRLPDGCNVR